MDIEISSYDELLKKFSAIPLNRNLNETFLSICGFPHYERVVSNILSFFFNSTREHGLKKCFSESLLELLGINADSMTDFETNTEEKTTNGKYIDILIHNEELNIIIENKIYADLYNDLEEYYNYVSCQYGKQTYGVVLGLYKYETNNKHFVSITYEELFTSIRKNLGFYITNSQSKYNIFLYDFMENIERLTRKINMNVELLKFLSDNAELAENLKAEMINLRNELRKAVKEVNQLLNEKIDLPKDMVELWEYRELPAFYDVAVLDYSKDGYSFAIDTMLDVKGWTISIFNRDNQNYETSLTFEKKLGKDFPGESGDRFVLKEKFAVDEERVTIADYVFKVFNKLTSE